MMRVVVDNLAFGYSTSDHEVREVLADLDLDVADGSFHALVGRNGCGKSTLLRLVAGLEQPARGSIVFEGTPRYDHATAMVFQTPRLLPWWTVERNVGTGIEFSGKAKMLGERIRDFYTSHVGLAGLGRRMPNQLSMGEQSRVGLGRALAHEADVLLLDEPFAQLDAISRRKVREDLERIWMIDGRTTILVTHDIEEAVVLGDRVTVMRGRPGPAVTTIEVDAPRPRHALGLLNPGMVSAISRVWEALEMSDG
jgi:ABC-type nitrate/sulfonate/bicarbonate transport system ATPase subunit